ncbi:MAG: AAA family ATPase [Saprospiraceae bacterium]|nr:AAA family ATPase [Candidatus Parvibacillus calidus]
MNTAIANNNFTMQDLEINDAFRLASQYVNETDEHVFITGNAGTGKTSFLRHISQNCRKNLVIAAPTGIAAINAGGTTLHSLFQLPFAPFVPTDTNKAELAASIRISRAKLDIIRNMDILVIDEVSMVQADILDAVDTILRSSRRQHNASFGGLQVLFIGDLNRYLR